MSTRDRLLGALVLCFAIWLTFEPLLGAGFVWDDHDHVVMNAHYRGLSLEHLRWMFSAESTRLGHWQPLTWVSLAVDHALWGMRSAGYHLTNLLLHVLNVLLFWAVAARLLAWSSWSSSSAIPRPAALGGLFAAALFALHPQRVEAVAWVTERRELLAATLYLLGLLSYLAARRADCSGDDKRRWRYLGAAFAAFCASGLAKAWVLTLPFVLLVLDAYPLRRLGEAAARRRALREKLVFAIPALCAGAIALFAIGQARALAVGHGFVDRCLQAAHGLFFYPLKLLWPAGLSPLYLLRTSDLTDAAHVLAAAAAPLLLVGLVLLRRRWPWLLAAGLAYAVLIAPVLGFAQAGQQAAADRYSYLALLPLALLAGAALAASVGRYEQRRARIFVAALCLGLLSVLALLSRRLTPIWMDDVALFSRALALDPANSVALTNRSEAHRVRGHLGLARADAERATRLAPRSWAAWNMRGNLAAMSGDFTSARGAYSRALTVVPKDATVRCNRAQAALALGDLAAAAQDFDRALRADPRVATCYVGRGLLYARRGQRQPALEDASRAIVLAPLHNAAWLLRGNLRRTSGDLQGALADLRRAVALGPRDSQAYAAWGQGLREAGRASEALAAFSKALRLEPALLPARVDRGLLRAMLGQLAGAVADFEEALRRAPASWPLRSRVEGFLARARRQRASETAPRGDQRLPRGARRLLR